MKKPICLYLRVSTSEQNVDSQKEDLTKWCRNNDYDIKGIFGETVSGYDQMAERVQYDLMKEFILKNKIKDIVVWEISRLSRSMVKTVNELDYFTKQGVNVHFRKENLESLSNEVTNQMILTILSSMAQMERDTFIERSHRGRMTSALRGQSIALTTIPYGFSSVDKMIVVNEEESKVVKLIYELALKGMTLYGISEHLNSLNIPTRMNLKGRKRIMNNGDEKDFGWKPNTVKQIIYRTMNKGIRTFKGIEIPIPSIISPDIWDKAQERFKNNVGYHNRTKYPYLFKTKMICGKCGRTLVTFKDKNTEYSYYRCTGINDRIIKCKNGKYINSKMVDEGLYKAIFTHQYIDEILHREATPILEMETKRKQIDNYINEIESLSNQIKRFLKVYTDGDLPYDEYKLKTNTLKSNSIQLQNSIQVLKNDIENMSKIDIKEIIKTYKTTTDFNIKREFVLKYINSIKVYKIDVAEVQWKNPLHVREKIIYIELMAFNYPFPIKVLMTPYSHNLIVSNNLQHFPEIDMIVDITKKGQIAPFKIMK